MMLLSSIYQRLSFNLKFENIGSGDKHRRKQVSFEEEPGLIIDKVIDTINIYVLVEKVVGGIIVEVLAIEKDQPIDFIVEHVTNL
jgi:hypothetical protein